jgi:hypothetical protein
MTTICTQTAGGTGTTHYIHELWRNVIAETGGGGATGTLLPLPIHALASRSHDRSGGTLREYIYLPEAEIAPTMQSATTVDRPLGLVNAVNTATPALWMVHVDHLNRPVRMTDAAKVAVWDAILLTRALIVRATSEGVSHSAKNRGRCACDHRHRDAQTAKWNLCVWTKDYPVEQRLRDMIGQEIADDTPQIMTLIVAREIFGREFV